MGFKSTQKNLTFSDLESSLRDEKNRSLRTLMDLDNTIAWDKVESILLRDYPVGNKKEGNKAYSPLLLFKCLLIQKWFRIKSDPELESQINDRKSFQTFLRLSSTEASPDHSTFSKFRKRLTKGKFDLIVGDILNQFADRGLSINEGIAVDARIVKSASRPVSNKKLEKLKVKSQTEEGKLDKNGNPLKFARDIESNWVVKNGKAYFGLKEHTAVDARHGFVLTTVLSQVHLPKKLEPGLSHILQVMPCLLTVSRRFPAVGRMFSSLVIIHFNIFKENSFSFFKCLKPYMMD